MHRRCTSPARSGASLSHALPTAKLKKAFACFLVIVAMKMLWSLNVIQPLLG